MRIEITALLAFVSLLIISSCSGDSPTRPIQKNLPGKWELSGVYNSGVNGAAPQWNPYKNGLVITIYPDSSYTASGQLSYELTPYTSDGKFYGYSPSDSSITHRYKSGDRLIKISLADSGQTLLLMGYCIGGCGHQFKRIP